jgi:1-acyl-sn-glycerol-3-phosphate acyltransferase
LQAFRERLSTYNGAAQDYFRDLDALTLKKQDYFIEATRRAFLAVQSQGTARDPQFANRFGKILPDIEKFYGLYHQFAQRGGVRYAERADALIFYFSALRDFYAKLPNEGTPPKINPGLRKSLFQPLESALQLAALLPATTSLGASLLWPAKPRAGDVDFTRNVKRVLNQLAANKKLKVKIEGEENLWRAPESREIDIFMPTHFQPDNDSLILGRLSPNDALIFARPDGFAGVDNPELGKLYRQVLERGQSFISVGSQATPIETTLQKLRDGVSHSIWIYPEGNMSAGFGETRPLQKTFSLRFLKALRKAGYRMRLIPITALNSDTFLHSASSPSDAGSEFQVKVHRPLSPDETEFLLGATDKSVIDQIIRGLWHETLPTDANRFQGQLRLKRAQEELLQRLLPTGAETAACVSGFFQKLSRNY